MPFEKQLCSRKFGYPNWLEDFPSTRMRLPAPTSELPPFQRACLYMKISVLPEIPCKILQICKP